MEATEQQHAFQHIGFPVRSFGGLNMCRYLIYRTPDEKVEVEAETAAEALRKSGMNEAVRIIRCLPGREVLLSTQELLGNASIAEPAPPASSPPSQDASDAA